MAKEYSKCIKCLPKSFILDGISLWGKRKLGIVKVKSDFNIIQFR